MGPNLSERLYDLQYMSLGGSLDPIGRTLGRQYKPQEMY